jgi:hypothetical protein
VSDRALSSWWFSAAPGQGTMIAGVPVAASSAMVLAPARVTITSVAAYSRGIRSS